MSINFISTKNVSYFLENKFMSINNNPCCVIVTVPSSSYGAAVRDAVQIHYRASRSRYLLSHSSPLFLSQPYSTLLYSTLSLPFSTILFLYSTFLFLTLCFCVSLQLCISHSQASYCHFSTIQSFSFLSFISSPFSISPLLQLSPLVTSFPLFIYSTLLYSILLSLYSYDMI